MAGSSDAGAHLLSFVGADYTTRLLSRVGAGRAAAGDRGRAADGDARHGARPATTAACCAPGLAADLVLFDPTRLAVGRTRLARDFPAESPRFVVDAEGYVALIVNGQVVLEHGRHTGALPGQLLRG